YAHALLQREVDLPGLDFDTWIDDSYIRSVYAQSGMDYDQMVASVVSAEPGAPGFKAAEIWFADQGLVYYDSIAEMLEAASSAQAEGKTIYSTYVYDHPTGLKLFGKASYMVRSDEGQVLAFLKKNDSEEHIAAHGGEALNQQAMLAALN
ncbi:MAG: sulfonate ABC transporter substrate-binding protein, partial [Pseudomonas sp.]